MKLRSILCGMLAFAAVVGCKEELPLEPNLNVSRTAAEVAAEGASITVEVTSNTTWNAEANQDWISSITPSQGTASEEPVTSWTDNPFAVFINFFTRLFDFIRRLFSK